MPTIKHVSDGGPDGTLLGQSATDLIGFYGKTPIVQPAAIADATDVISALESLGLIATV